jgi:(p)ppGpp synthase/HD superfamily hydrolase
MARIIKYPKLIALAVMNMMKKIHVGMMAGATVRVARKRGFEMVQKFGTLDDAIALATFAHRNQKDKAGLDYIQHPLRVLAKVQAQGAMPYVQIAAILHDVTEDTSFTHQMLLDLGFSEAAVRLIRLLDRKDSKERYYSDLWQEIFATAETKIPTVDEFYYEGIRNDPGAKMVKLADREDNLSPWRLSYLTKETRERLILKYAHALEVLNG